MNAKRAAYLCEKWTEKGWYDWGVSADTGWLTAEGIEAAQELRAKEDDYGSR